MPKTRTPVLRPGSAKAAIVDFIQTAEAAPTTASVVEAVAAAGFQPATVSQGIAALKAANVLGRAGKVKTTDGKGAPMHTLRVTRKGLRSVEAMLGKTADAEVPAAA